MMRRAARRRKRGLAQWVAAPVLLVLIGGCPSRFDPRAEPLAATSADPAAQRDYREARSRLDAGDFADARVRFRDFRAAHPGDPLAQGAALWEARAALSSGDPAGAAQAASGLASPAADAISERARFLLGLALAQSETPADATRARLLLRPFVATIAAGDDAIELHAALAAAAARLGDVGDALAEYTLFLDGARPIEKRHIKERAGMLVEKLGDAEALALYNGASRDGLACALLGPRLTAAAKKRGDPAAAQTFDGESRAAQRRLGLEDGEGVAAIDQFAVGLVLPLSGRNRLTGERALRGALLAADAIPPGGSTLELRVRDTESSPERAAAVVDELAQGGVLALVASPDRAESSSSVARAEALGMPLLELSPDEVKRGGLTFKLIRPNPARAEALAARAVSLGGLRFGSLFPENAYGRKMAESFAAAARARGAKIVAELPFEERATTFIAQGKKLREAHLDAVFVPAPASQLELIAAQLAASGVTRLPPKEKGKPALLCATADGLTVKLLQSAGRYVQGAVLCPVFYADAADAHLAPFVDRFRRAYGEDPGAADALGYDAVLAVRSALGKFDPNRGRSELGRYLATARDPGATGPLGFTAEGERAGLPQLYLVDGEAIRALR